MLRLQWNALRAGDQVLVHDADDLDLKLVPGVVSLVETSSGSNVIAISLNAVGGKRLVKPNRLSVHTDPVEFDQQCWRCDRPTPVSRHH